MTLVEVMVALGILSILATSVISVTFQIRSLSEQTVYQNTAMTLAQGYMEQVRHLDYTTLSAAAQDTASPPTEPLPLARTTGTLVTPLSGSVFGNGSYAQERIFLDQNAAGTPIQPMDFKFRVLLTSLESVTGNVAAGVEVTVEYEITYNYGIVRVVRGALRSVRSSVPTY